MDHLVFTVLSYTGLRIGELDVRRMIAKVINILLKEGEITVDKAKTIATLSNTSLKSMELGDLAERMNKIEKMFDNQV
jgi:hypothetical protein